MHVPCLLDLSRTPNNWNGNFSVLVLDVTNLFTRWASPMVLTLENFRITLMLDVAEFARIQQGSAIL